MRSPCPVAAVEASGCGVDWTDDDDDDDVWLCCQDPAGAASPSSSSPKRGKRSVAENAAKEDPLADVAAASRGAYDGARGVRETSAPAGAKDATGDDSIESSPKYGRCSFAGSRRSRKELGRSTRNDDVSGWYLGFDGGGGHLHGKHLNGRSDESFIFEFAVGRFFLNLRFGRQNRCFRLAQLGRRRALTLAWRRGVAHPRPRAHALAATIDRWMNYSGEKPAIVRMCRTRTLCRQHSSLQFWNASLCVGCLQCSITAPGFGF